MDKNYYEILQVNEKATKEVIDKVFRMLAKKYHPDLQKEEEEKIQSAEVFKEINEAYQVLSDPQKRIEYDKQLEVNNISKEDFITIFQENEKLRNIIKEMKNNANDIYKTEDTANVRYQPQPEQRRAQEANNEYYTNEPQPQYYYKEENKIKEFFIDKLKLIITIAIVIGLVALIFQIPFVNKFFKSMYENNVAIKFIVDMVMNIFSG